MADDILSMFNAAQQSVAERRNRILNPPKPADALSEEKEAGNETGAGTGFEESQAPEPEQQPRLGGTFQRAQTLLNLAGDGGMLPDVVAAKIKKSRETGLPLKLVMDTDNAKLDHPKVDGLHPAAAAFVAESPENAALVRDDLKGIDAIARAAETLSDSLKTRRSRVLEKIRAEGYSEAQMADLRAEGYELDLGASLTPGNLHSFIRRLPNGEIDRANMPVLDKWYASPEEYDKLFELRNKVFSEQARKEIAHDTGATVGTGTGEIAPELAPDYIRQLGLELAAMEALHAYCGDRWKDADDASMRELLTDAGKLYGIDFSMVRPERLRRAGIENGETDWGTLTDFFGIRSISKLIAMQSPERLLEVLKDPGRYSPEEQTAVIRALEEQSRLIRGSTGWNTTVENTLGSFRFIGEFLLTAPLAGAGAWGGAGARGAASVATAAARTSFLKWAGKSLLRWAGQEAMRLPAYVPGVVAKTALEVQAQPTVTIQNGQLVAALTEDKTGEFATHFVNNLLDQYMENYSERVGELIGAPKLGKLLARLPAGVRNRAVIQGINNALTKLDANAAAKFIRVVSERGSWNGLPGEYFEEKFKQVMMLVSSEIAQAVGSDVGDFGNVPIFGTWEQEGELFGSLALTGGILGTARLFTGGGRDAVMAARFLDSTRELNRRVQESQLARRDPESAVNYVRFATGIENDITFMPAEEARILLQSSPEQAAAIGIDEETVARAENTGEMIPVSRAEVAVKVAPEHVDEVISKLVPNPQAGLTADEAKKINLTDEAQKEFEEKLKRRIETDAALKELTEEIRKLDIPDSVKRANLSILTFFADYFARESNMTAAEWLRKVAIMKAKDEPTFLAWMEEQRRQNNITPGVTVETNPEAAQKTEAIEATEPGQQDADAMRTDADALTQGEKSGPARGAFSWNDTLRSMIVLFENAADASTLTHEISHYAAETMRHLVESGVASEKMREDFEKLRKWAEQNTPDPVEQKEKIARGFEAYMMEGKAPTAELEGAFATMRRVLMRIYRSVKALNVNLTDEVRQVFDGMLASDAAIEQDEVLRRAAEQINLGLLGLSQGEAKVFRELITKAREQALTKLTERKKRELDKNKRYWRGVAESRLKGIPVYDAWDLIRETDGLDFDAVKEIAGEAAAKILRGRGLTARGKNKKGVHPVEIARKAKYANVAAMLTELQRAAHPKAVVADYVNERVREFEQNYDASEAAVTAEATVEALDKLSELLAVKGGRAGAIIRRRELQKQVREAIRGMTVKTIMSESAMLGNVRRNARALTAAANKSDWLGALESAEKLRRNIELLRERERARKTIERTKLILYRGRHAKAGSIDGAFQDALKDLSGRFKFARMPEGLQHNTSEVVDIINQDRQAHSEPELEISPLILTGIEQNYKNLTFDQLEELGWLAEYIYDEGRDRVSAAKESFNNEVNTRKEEARAQLKPLRHKFRRTTRGIGWAYRTTMQFHEKLRNIMGAAGQWDENGAILKLYNELAYAASFQYQLMNAPFVRASQAMRKLFKSTHTRSLDALADITFPADVQAEGYTGWNWERVVAVCLNMGNEKNRQRLIDGYEWGERGNDYLARIASMLTAEEWECIQDTWDAISDPELLRNIQTQYREEYHHDLRLEEALPFTVVTADGQTREMAGGYYPLSYLFHKNAATQNKSELADGKHPVFGLAKWDSTYTRREKVSDPVRLSINLVYEHLYDASHYAAFRHIARVAMRVVTDTEFRHHFEQTQGFERYQAFRKLIQNTVAPDAAVRDAVMGIETWARGILAASALWLSPTVVGKQFASVTVGMEEIYKYYPDAVARFYANMKDATDRVYKLSGVMRERGRGKDFELKQSLNLFDKSWAKRRRDEFTEIGYWAMAKADMMVAIPAWMAAFDKAFIDLRMDEKHAIAYADEFVSKTQGGARAIDMSLIQLHPLGRVLTVFFSAASGQLTTTERALSKLRHGKMSAAEGTVALICAMGIPTLLSAAIQAAFSPGGDDDPDRAQRAFLRELLTNPFTALPIWGQLENTVVYALTSKNKNVVRKRDWIEMASMRGLNDLVATGWEAFDAIYEQNPERAMYKLADFLGTLYKVPVVTMYERIERIMEGYVGDDSILPNFDKRTKRSKSAAGKKRHKVWE